jgi:hypothetical protein
MRASSGWKDEEDQVSASNRTTHIFDERAVKTHIPIDYHPK